MACSQRLASPHRPRQALDTLEALWIAANGRAIAGGTLAAAGAPGPAAAGVAGAAAGAVSELDCVACVRGPRNTRLRPCCHVLLCKECAQATMARDRRCPGCSAPLTRFDAGFFESEDPTAA